MEKFDVTVILPLASASVRSFDDLFERSIKSLKNQSTQINELLIVHSTEETLVSRLSNFDFEELPVRLVENTGDTDFASQVNLGLKESTSKWVSILEFDDEYSSIWFKNVKEYEKAYDDVDVFLPLVVDTDEKGVFAGFTNEAVFAVSMNSEMGYLTNDLLLNYQNFQTSGMVIKKDKFLESGGFKPSIRLTFVYELFLRMTYNSNKIMTIPKIGYKHTNMREGSLFWTYKYGEEKISDDEVSFWLDTAKKEHFFTSDRNIKYVEENA
jgi:hypothetical protein